MPTEQAHGLATQTLAEFEQLLPEHVQDIAIFTDAGRAKTHRFYEKMGYVDTRHENMDAGFEIVQMKKSLVATAAG